VLEDLGVRRREVALLLRNATLVNPNPRLRPGCPSFRCGPQELRGRRTISGVIVVVALLAVAPARAQVTLPLTAAKPMEFVAPFSGNWLDRTHHGLHRLVARTARSIDGWMGPPLDHEVYEEASGSIAFAMLWDEFDGVDGKVRFRVDMPLPQINKRLRLFVGRVNRDEVVTERNEYSGAFPQWRSGADEEEQTLAGLVYSQPERHGGSFSASAGARVRSSALDPYVKTSYRYRRVLWGDTLFTAKETLFYQLSEKFGLTTRLDLERMLGENWRLRWTGSATISEGTDGARGFSNLTATRMLPGRRALIFRAGVEGDTAAEVPLEEFGVKVGYRRSVVRDWLVLELRTSLTWPKELRDEPRKPSWGFGIGCEMYFGSDEFSSQPVTF
jgi:hypothetical protein